MHQQQVLAHAEAEAGPVAAMGEVDVVEVEAVEGLAVEGHRFEDFSPAGEKHAVEGFDGDAALGRGVVVIDGERGFGLARGAMDDEAGRIDRAAVEPEGGLEFPRAGDADQVELFEALAEHAGKGFAAQQVDVVVAQDERVVAGQLDAAGVALGEALSRLLTNLNLASSMEQMTKLMPWLVAGRGAMPAFGSTPCTTNVPGRGESAWSGLVLKRTTLAEA